MFEYIKQGWMGQLTFTQVLFGKHLERLEYVVTVIAYVGFYVLLLMAYKAYSLQNMWVYLFLIYGVGFYLWLIRAFWGSANHSKSKIRATLIRIFAILLPIISIILFILIFIYWIVTALLDSFGS